VQYEQPRFPLYSQQAGAQNLLGRSNPDQAEVCAMAAKKEPETGFQKALRWFHVYSDLQTLWPLAVAIIVAARRLAHMPSTWYPLQYVLSPLAWLFGTWAVLGTLAFGYKKSLPTVKQWWNPHSLVINLNEGNSAIIEIRHQGGDAVWEARRRIVKTMDKSVNPDPVWRLCNLKKDGDYVGNSPLHDGETAHLMLVSFSDSRYSSGRMFMHNDEKRSGVEIPDKGVIVELSFKAIPAAKNGTLSKCIHCCPS
jgi:hypothetical protein